MKLTLALLGLLGIAMVPVMAEQSYKFVCYFPNWSYYRNSLGKYTVEDVDPSMCTHLMYAFAVLDENTYELKVADPFVDLELGYYEKFTGLKSQNPELKTLLSLGGWNDSQSPKYSQLVADPQKVANFIEKVIPLLEQFHFDGLDVDWEFPAEEDKENFASFIAALASAFRPRGLLLSIAASASISQLDKSYDVFSLAQNLDMLNLMTYDFHGAEWEPGFADHHAPLSRRPFQADDSDAESGLQAWLHRGFPAEKIILGVPVYGRSWRLQDANNVSPPAPSNGPGSQGPYTEEAGYKGFYEIGLDIRQPGWTVVQDPEGNMGPYAYGGEGEWIGFDDIPMAVRKTKYSKEKGLGGVMVWEISVDDFRNLLGTGVNPFTNAIREELLGARSPKSTMKQLRPYLN